MVCRLACIMPSRPRLVKLKTVESIPALCPCLVCEVLCVRRVGLLFGV